MRMLRTTQRNARIAAVLLTAASPLAAAFPVVAQDMTLDAKIAACEQIKDHGKSAQCHADTYRADVKERIQIADVRIAENDTLSKCISFLKTKKASGVVLDPTRLNREKGCAYAKDLGMQ